MTASHYSVVYGYRVMFGGHARLCSDRRVVFCVCFVVFGLLCPLGLCVFALLVFVVRLVLRLGFLLVFCVWPLVPN